MLTPPRHLIPPPVYQGVRVSPIISEKLFISWRLKKQIGENVMYVTSVLKSLLSCVSSAIHALPFRQYYTIIALGGGRYKNIST